METRDGDGCQPLFAMAQLDKLKTAIWLIDEKKANPNCRGYENLMPLHVAKSKKMINALLDREANPALTNRWGHNALMQQISNVSQYAACVVALLEHPRGRALVNVGSPGGFQGRVGWTALHCAVDPHDDGPWPEAIELLLKAGADPTIEDDWGRTPLALLGDSMDGFEDDPAAEEARELLEAAEEAMDG